MSDDIPFKTNEDGEFAVPCQIKLSPLCMQNGEYCDTKEEAREWVEDDCWIFSGEGFICLRCNEQIFVNLGNIRGKHAPGGK